MNKSIAVKYDERFPAPMVIARGKGKFSDRILETAEKNGIKIVRSEELAESLFMLDVGDLIPEGYYEIFAEILHFIYYNETEIKGDL